MEGFLPSRASFLGRVSFPHLTWTTRISTIWHQERIQYWAHSEPGLAYGPFGIYYNAQHDGWEVSKSAAYSATPLAYWTAVVSTDGPPA
ncbi:hypothetical protein AC578_3001 [Pseudocercospora eumusae]|uniref:Uncharacterized protein n=1 Tax=Pseudocercospora eumusae TaxID=321146 RepID=A0A139GTR6_9PEZI|nr:hypothetical protein AC578_3001 [Pseudocercospora eumusae]